MTLPVAQRAVETVMCCYEAESLTAVTLIRQDNDFAVASQATAVTSRVGLSTCAYLYSSDFCLPRAAVLTNPVW
jgi:hypothetical protein